MHESFTIVDRQSCIHPDTLEEPLVLSAEDFIKGLKGQIIEHNGQAFTFLEKDTVRISNLIVKENVEINASDKFAHHIVISKHTNFFGKFSIDGSAFYGSIRIEGGTFWKNFWIDNGIFARLFKISDGLFKGGMTIFGGTFDGRFRITGGTFQGSLSIVGGTFVRIFRVTGGTYHNGFVVAGGSFQGTFRIGGGNYKGNVKINGGVFHSNFGIKGGAFEEGLTIEKGKFLKFEIIRGKFDKIFFGGGEVSDIFEIKSSGSLEIGLLEIDQIDDQVPTKINTLIFNLMPNNSNKVIIKKFTEIKTIRAAGSTSQDDLFYLHQLPQECLDFSHFINRGLTRIEGKVHKGSTFYMHHSDLFNVVLNDLDFRNFKQIIVKNSILNSINIIGEQFPLNTKNIYTSFNKKEAVKMAQIYNQLYLSAQKQGNKSHELKYYAKYQNFELKLAFKKIDIDKMISLGLSKVSSNFGQNWLFCVFWFIMISFLCFNVYVLGIKWGECTQQVNLEFYLKYYFKFINPLRQEELIKCARLTSSMIFVDLIWRISATYLTYQLIAAFRRFGRK